MSKPSIPPSVDPAILRLRDWYSRVGDTEGILDKGGDLFEEVTPGPGETFPFPLLRPKEVKTTAEIRVLCESLLGYVWHFGDYIQLVLRKQRGLSEKQAKHVVNAHIEKSECLQRIAFLVNTAKHAEAPRSWGQDDAPRLTAPIILAPDGYGTYCGVKGEGWTEFRGTFSGPIIQSMAVMGSRDRWFGDARWHAEYGAASWLALLRRLELDDWVVNEISRLVEAVAAGVAREQRRTGVRQTLLQANIKGPEQPVSLLIKWSRPPPVFLLFSRQTQQFISAYDIGEHGFMIA